MTPIPMAIDTPIFSRILSLTSRSMVHGSAAKTKSMSALYAAGYSQRGV